MPALANARHEKYCQARVTGLSVDKAYVEAGYKRNNANAARLNGKDSIRDRIRELQEQSAEAATVTATEIIEGLRRNYRIASGQLPVAVGPVSDNGIPIEPYALKIDVHAANKALELLAKTINLFSDNDNDRPAAAVIVQYPVQQ